jgi:predicted enzyme involved in methoxymalonyl-ACP biosynthesis
VGSWFPLIPLKRVPLRAGGDMLLDQLCDLATQRGLRMIRGTYVPTSKNGLVAEHYPGLGFAPASMTGAPAPDGRTLWELTLSGRTPLPTFIEVRRNG